METASGVAAKKPPKHPQTRNSKNSLHSNCTGDEMKRRMTGSLPSERDSLRQNHSLSQRGSLGSRGTAHSRGSSIGMWGGKGKETPSGEDKEGSRSESIYAIKCIVIVSHYGFFPQYLDFLSELYRISLSPSAMPMERYIVNFARETPLPPRGCLRIRYQIGQRTIMFSRPPPNQPIDSPPFPFAELFKVLTPDVAIDVFTALLLEYRVVMVSTPYTNLTLVSELLIRLMYPFSYEHVYIPILPKTLMEFLAAPMPFCIGVPREFLEISDLKDILEDKENMIIVDLDHNQVISNVPLTRLPRAELTKLQKRLKPLSKLYVPRENMSPLQRKAFDGRDSAFNYIPSPEELDFINQSIPSINDGEVTSVQAAFLRVFVSIFKDYRRFLIQRDDASKSPKSAAPGTTHQTNDEQTEGKHPFESYHTRCASAPTNESMCPGMFMEEPAFKTDEYIRKATKDARPFLTKFLDTQAFLRFADQRVCGGPLPGEVENFDIKFFDEAIIAKNNRSRFRFSKPTPFLQSKTYDITETLPAPDPDTSGLTEGRIYQHDYFPRLDPDLFQAVKIETTKPLMEKIDKLAPRTTLHPLRNSSRKMRRMHTDSSIPNLVRQLSQQKLNANSKSGRRQRTLSRVSRSFLAELSHIVKPPELVEHPDMDRNDHSSRRRLSS